MPAPRSSPRRTPLESARRASAPALLLLALFASSGCLNPFRPGDPAPPSTGSNEIQVPVDYATPQGLLTTISEAFVAKTAGNGVSAYIGAFADPLRDGYELTVAFDPDVVQDRINAGKVIPAWSRSLEIQFFSYVVAQDPGEYSLRWTPDAIDEVDLTAGTAELRQQYSVITYPGGGASPAQVAFGHVVITLRRVSGENRWVITRWEDHRDPAYDADPQGANAGYKTFSRLRIDSTEQG